MFRDTLIRDLDTHWTVDTLMRAKSREVIDIPPLAYTAPSVFSGSLGLDSLPCP
ncbi:hypothetical protein BDP27DRAFT_1312237 [Rhodocollybia butyracea]|uniref:Uncharacterized protein n=1 Tax=Rhodocollybia butyracea TaxID=206335 RepID=A0A9P5Q9G9_9AGAR|nr:hypothetical protein BDP27DRAFT_1312237 [Rhodocollybia butyracea]